MRIKRTLAPLLAVTLLLGGIYLIATKVISPVIPVTYLATVAVLSAVSGHDPIVQLLSGGLMLGAFFMATDWVTTPTTPKGEVIFAIGCGFFTFLIRCFGSLPEGVSLATLLMNMVSPTIERYCRPKKFGFVKVEKSKEAKA